MKVPSNAPVCIECAEKYGEPVRSEFPLWMGNCSVCGAPGPVCRAKDFGYLPGLPISKKEDMIRMALTMGFDEIPDNYRGAGA